jgi:CDP-4-dehydro-6-deoxyglucose reductase, E3
MTMSFSPPVVPSGDEIASGLSSRCCMPRDNVQCVAVDKIPRTPDIVELRLRPIGPRLPYLPGQYVEIHGPGPENRPFSISNAPRGDGEMSLLVSRAAGGAVSAWIHDVLVAGDRVRLSGPYGTFICDPARSGPVLCLAGGSGLAPILALAEVALGRGCADPVTVLFSARTEHDLLARGLFAHWEAQHPNFHLVTTLTRSRAAGSLHGRIPDVLHEVIPDLRGYQVFIGGSAGFVEACLTAARGEGAAEDHLHPIDWQRQRPCLVQPLRPGGDAARMPSLGG